MKNSGAKRLKHFSCNGAVDWSTTCFCCESVLQIGWEFCDRSAWFSRRVRDSSQSSCSISPCHQELASKLRGYWFYTREERWLCKNPSNTGFRQPEWHRVATRSTVWVLSMASLTTAIFLGVRTVFIQPPFFFSVEPVASMFRTRFLMAWADGTARLRWIANSLRNSRWAITKLSPFL